MKALKAVTAVIIISAITLASWSCSSTAASAAKSSVATVQRGSLSVAVTGTGNLALSTSQDLAFQIAGYVSEVLVKEGEAVKKGQELAKLDTSEWDKQVKKLETALVTAQRNLDSKVRALAKSQDQVTAKENAIIKAERQLTAKENDIAKAERLVAAKELAVRSAELDVESAEYNVTRIAEVKVVQDDIDNAEFAVKFAQRMRDSGASEDNAYGATANVNVGYWGLLAIQAQKQLDDANDRMEEIRKGTSISLTTDVKIQVARAQIQVEQSQRALEEAKIAVNDARFAVEDARLAKKDAELAVRDAISNKADAEQAVADAKTAVADAEQAVADARADLDEAKGLSPIITAPLDGFIPKIYVSGGDEIFKGKVAMQLADPNQFEAVILVAEKNISNLKVGQSATIALDALAGVTFPAQITKIATLATSSSGVVNYQVTVKLTSLQPITRSTTGQTSAGSGTASSGTAPTSRPSVLPGSQSASRAGASSNTTAASAIPTVSLKSGMSAVVTVVIQQKDNVLKVPSRAITRQGQNSTVEVVTADGTETRIVKTGMSDSANTEITEGLNEGDQVVIKASTTATTSTSGANRAPTAPGLGGILR